MESRHKRNDLLKKIIRTCPKCGSKDNTIAEYQDIPCMTCKKCGYDERDLYDIVPNERTSQKAKGEHTPYKTGGAKRTQKR